MAIDRTVLPIKEPLSETTQTLDVRKATSPPRFEVKAADGAPNVLLILLDDLGFAGTSAFGGSVATQNFDRITAGGLKYNNFHTTAVCSPTRTALKSGRNHHVNNMGGISETGTSFPGNTGLTAAGTRCVRSSLPAKSPKAWSPREPSSPRGPKPSPLGTPERKSKFNGRIPKLTVEVK